MTLVELPQHQARQWGYRLPDFFL